jgi:glycerate dehydrogenase
MGNTPNLKVFETLGEFTAYQVTSPPQTIERLKNADVAISCKVVIGKREMDQLPNLKLICVAATGTNNIDLDYAKSKGIEVKNVAAYSTNSVAQATFSMVLVLLNNVQYFDSYVKSGDYAANDMFTHIGRTVTELNGKTYGVIGLGAIGKKVAEIAKSFGCNIIYYSTSGKNNNSEYQQVTLEQLLKTSDVISIHCPLNDLTRNLITYERLSLMKPSAIIINMARGGIVDESALAKALDEDKIAGAGTDVYSIEPVTLDNPLLNIKNKEKIILSPHSAWTSVEARTLLIERIAENIREFRLKLGNKEAV